MPSKSKSVREAQKKQCEAAISARRAALKEKGLDSKAIGKDPKLKALLAKFRQIQKTLVAIQAKEKKNEELAKRKTEKAEQAKQDKAEKKGKSKKKAGKKAEEPSGKKAKKKE
jgi:hypothetical protein